MILLWHVVAFIYNILHNLSLIDYMAFRFELKSRFLSFLRYQVSGRISRVPIHIILDSVDTHPVPI